MGVEPVKNKYNVFVTELSRRRTYALTIVITYTVEFEGKINFRNFADEKFSH